MNLTTLIEQFWLWFWADPTTHGTQLITTLLTVLVTVLALLREIARRVEDRLVAEFGPHGDSRFWRAWIVVMAVLDAISLSLPRNPRTVQALHEWKRGRTRRPSLAVAPVVPAAPINPNPQVYFFGIGLNRVDPAKYDGWDGRLVACLNDVRDVYAMVRGAVGSKLKSDGVTLLADEQATSAAVDAAYADFAKRAKPGDLVIVHSSRHGGQFYDPEGDEADGFDETMVLWDRQVPDDEHALWLARFLPGVRVLLITDACHSATIARDVAASGQPAEFRPKCLPRSVAERASEIQAPEIRAVRKGMPIFPPQPRATILALSACLDKQVAYDGAVNGEFTGALLKAVATGKARNYNELLKAVQKLCRNQTPQLTGYGPKAALDAFTRQRPFTL